MCVYMSVCEQNDNDWAECTNVLPAGFGQAGSLQVGFQALETAFTLEKLSLVPHVTQACMHAGICTLLGKVHHMTVLVLLSEQDH